MKACRNMFAVFQQKLDRCMYRMQAFFGGVGGGSCGCLYYMLDRITFHKKKKKKLFDKTYANPPLCKVPVLFLTFS